MAKLSREGSRNPQVKRIASRFRRNGLLWLDDWMRLAFYYQPEREEIIRTPRFMAEEIRTRGHATGDCDDVATFIAAVAKAAGFPVRFVAIRGEGSNPEFTHVFAEIHLEGEWLVIDPTVPYGTEYVHHGRMTQYV